MVRMEIPERRMVRRRSSLLDNNYNFPSMSKSITAPVDQRTGSLLPDEPEPDFEPVYCTRSLNRRAPMRPDNDEVPSGIVANKIKALKTGRPSDEFRGSGGVASHNVPSYATLHRKHNTHKPVSNQPHNYDSYSSSGFGSASSSPSMGHVKQQHHHNNTNNHHNHNSNNHNNSSFNMNNSNGYVNGHEPKLNGSYSALAAAADSGSRRARRISVGEPMPVVEAAAAANNSSSSNSYAAHGLRSVSLLLSRSHGNVAQTTTTTAVEANGASNGSGSNGVQHVGNGSSEEGVEMLLSELDAAKELNKRLSLQLARAERDLQSLSIQHSLQADRLEATLASRLADYMHNGGGGGGVTVSAGSASSSLVSPLSAADSYAHSAPATLPNQKKSYQQSPSPRNGVDESSVLTPSQISAQADHMLSYVNQQKNGEHSESGRQPSRLQLQAAIEEMCADREMWLNKNAELRAALSRTESELVRLRQQVKSSGAATADGDHQQQQLSRVRADLEKQRQEWLSERAELLMKISALKSTGQPTSEMELRCRELQRDLERAMAEKEELTLQLNTMENRMAAERFDIVPTRNQPVHDAVRDELKAEVSRMKNQLDEERLNRLNNEKSFDANQRQLDELRGKLQSLQSRDVGSGRALGRDESELSGLQSQLATVKRQLDAANDEKQRLNAKLHEADAHNERLKQQQSAAAARLAEAEADDEKAELRQEVQQLREDRQRAQALAEQMRAERDRANSELESAELTISRLEKVIDNLKQRVAEAETRTPDADDNAKELKSELERSRSELSRSKSRHEEAQQRWNHDMYELQRKYEEADASLYDMKEQILVLKRQLEQLQATPASTPRTLLNNNNNNNGDDDVDQLKHINKENKKLKEELQTQQRLITVLRRKLAQANGT